MPVPEDGGITAVVQPTGEMAAAAVETLLHLLNGEPPTSHRCLLTPHLVPGASTGPAASVTWRL
jgi:DNA-binding LacI/PurR family transcriptional regulator